MELKTKLSEEDVKMCYITPALNQKNWGPQDMRCEYSFTAGRVVTLGSMAARRAGKRVDYLLLEREDQPIAVVEAKDNNHAVADGIQQAIDYATNLDVHFAYSSNGEGFVEHVISDERYDFGDQIERTLSMDEFPTLIELQERLRNARKTTYTAEGEKLLNEELYSDSDSYPPRYYQRIAINRVIEAVASGQKRIMLVMATGTGKTYTAFQIIHRLHHSGMKKRILYIADRNILIDQTMRHDFKPFRKFMTKVQDRDPEEGYEIYMSLYTQWVDHSKEGDDKQLYRRYRPDFFDLVIIDECHRSSINEQKEWHKMLEYFGEATQIGLTATPKRKDEDADNYKYFGEPVYKYTLKDGIEDGFLAPYNIVRDVINQDLTGYWVKEGEMDRDGNLLCKDLFIQSDYGRTLSINKRNELVAREITAMLKEIGPMTKTIVFCPDQEEAAEMRRLLIELNPALVKKNPNYVVRITSDDRVGKKLLDDFIDPESNYPVIATTSELLTTGVDCKTCGLIVIDKEVSNIITFKQMIGRGTRIHEDSGKLYFYILDFRGATNLFFDKEFDGEPEVLPHNEGNGGIEGRSGSSNGGGNNNFGRENPPKYHVEGQGISVVQQLRMRLDADGKLITTSITDLTRDRIRGKYPSLSIFRGAWKEADRKQAILDELEDGELMINALREEHPELCECDIFDIICHVAYSLPLLTRRQRVERLRQGNLLDSYEGKMRQVLDTLLDKYADVGVREIEDNRILSTSEFAPYGNRAIILKRVFKGPKDYDDTIGILENEIYAEAN